MECAFAIDDRQVTAKSHGKRFRQKEHQAVFIANVSRFIPGNQLTLLLNGAAFFPAIEAAFDRAWHEIYLETYIYENDVTGRRVADALKRAALRGVNV
jgi:cardiolipin synthase A/B